MNVSGAWTTSLARSRYRVAAVIGQRMQDRQRVVAGLDDLVQIADRTGLDRSGQRAVGPHDITAGHHESADEIRAGQVVVAADGDHGPLQQHAHVLDESGLAAPGRAGQHHRYASVEGLLEQLNFVAVREIGIGGHRCPLFFGGSLWIMRRPAHGARGPARVGAPRRVGCAATDGARTLLAVGRPGWGLRRRNTSETPASLASSTACAASAQAYRPS